MASVDQNKLPTLKNSQKKIRRLLVGLEAPLVTDTDESPNRIQRHSSSRFIRRALESTSLQRSICFIKRPVRRGTTSLIVFA